MKRWQKVKKHLDNADAALVLSPQNRRYLSGFPSTDGMVLVTKGKGYLITDFRYITAAKDNPENLKTILMDKRWDEIIIPLLQEHNIKKIGFEEDYLSVSKFEDMKDKLKGIEFVPFSKNLSAMRTVKDDEEIEKIKKAQIIADSAFSHILGFIKKGVKENDITLELECFMRKNGAGGIPFDIIAVSGERSAMPHGSPSDRVLTDGDFLTLDFGAEYDGYCSDMTRTVAIGYADDEMRKIYNVVLQAQENALQNIKAGMTGAEIDGLARNIIEQNGYGKYFGHGLGHGVGIDVHEEPKLNSKSSGEISENSVVTIEPGIYIEGRFGVRIEDMIVVKKDGIENLAKSKKELIII